MQEKVVEEKIEEKLKDKIKRFFGDVFSIEDNKASNADIKSSIVSGSKLKGPNMCILVLAIIIACVGLNMNSTAVVIGAMLISPLMGCILGIGYGIASNDLKFAKRSFAGLIIEVVICIITSTIYFLISPISTTSHELLARTSPTIWDAIIAITGGLAGIIGITRKEKTNVIPGVAIATAIMPPLCTAGFGIATWQLKYLLGALYLFFINGFFICLTAILVLRAIKIPKKKGIDENDEKRIHRNLIILAVITIIPSIILAYQIVNESMIEGKIQKYLTKEFQYEGTQIVSSKTNIEKGNIEITLIGKILDEVEITKLTEKLKNYDISNMNLKITQTEVSEGISQEEIQALIEKELGKTDSKISTTKDTSTKTTTQSTLTDKISEAKEETSYNIEEIKTQIKEKYSKINNCTITKNKTVNKNDNTTSTSIIVSLELNDNLAYEENIEIENWLKEKIGNTEITITKNIK